MQLKQTLFTATLLGFSLNALALPFATYESRSAGMGTTGVASSNIAGAPFINPAMLSAQRFEEDFSLVLGTGIQVLDNENLLADIEAFNDAINSGNAAAYNAAALNASGKRLDLIGNGSVNVGFSAEEWAGAVSANTYVQSNTGIKYAGFSGFDSTIDLVSLEVSEVGVSFARRFGNLSIGVTPKSQSVTSYDSNTILLRTISDFNDVLDAATTSGRKEHGSSFNADIGIVYRFGEFSNWQMGIVKRNVSEQSFTTSAGTTVKIEPQTRAGIAYNGDIITLAVDYDLTENEPLVAGGEKTRMLAAGIEADILDSLKLRAGYARNTADVAGPDVELGSLGIGLNVLGAQIDAAVMGNDNHFSAYLQLGVQF